MNNKPKKMYYFKQYMPAYVDVNNIKDIHLMGMVSSDYSIVIDHKNGSRLEINKISADELIKLLMHYVKCRIVTEMETSNE